MKKRLSLLLAILTVLLVPHDVSAIQDVGALADRLSSGSTVSLRGKTAPWSELVVVDPILGDQVIAVAELEPSGEFSFSFRIDSVGLSRVVMFGVDEAGITSRVKVSGYVGSEILMPPTIVNDQSDTSTTSLALRGYTYPGSDVEVRLTNDQGGETVVTISANTAGEWKILENGLTAGKYTGIGISRSGSLESEPSQEIFFEITAVGIPTVVTNVTKTVIGLLPLPEGLKNLVINNPDNVSRALAPIAALPVVGIWLADLFALLLRLFLGLLHLFGWKKDRRSWGVVYDSVTKQPLSRVIVRLYQLSDHSAQNTDAGRLVETDVTGNEGVFAFLPQAGRYFVKVVKAGYKFPSELVSGSGRDGEYEFVYHGEAFGIKEADEEIRLSLPMDADEVKVDWWFFARRILLWLWVIVGWVLLVAGLLMALVAANTNLSMVNVLVVIFYLGLLLWRTRSGWYKERQWSVVRDSATGQPVANVSVALYEVSFNRLIQRRVSNERGRFLLVVPAGRYRLEVAATEWEADYEAGKLKKGYTGQEVEVKGEKNKALRIKLWVRSKKS